MVIAIIAILAALLLPSLKSARDKAKSVQCMNNLKQVGTGIALYAQDNDGAIVAHTTWNVRIDRYIQPSGKSVPPYTGSGASGAGYFSYARVWSCPSQPAPLIADSTFGGGLGYRGLNYGYVANQDMVFSGGAATNSVVRMDAVADPARKLLVMDNLWGTNGGAFWANRYAPGGTLESVGYPHANGANVLFVDGHVQSLSSSHDAWQALNSSDIYRRTYWSP